MAPIRPSAGAKSGYARSCSKGLPSYPPRSSCRNSHRKFPSKTRENDVHPARMMPTSDCEGVQQQSKRGPLSMAPGQSTEADRMKLRARTFGFPALRTESKRVTFTPPLYARCVALDGSWSTDCRVLIVSNDGARLLVRNPEGLNMFLLFFVSSPKPVFRRCRRIWVRRNELEVSYERLQPSFALERNPPDEAPLRLLDR